MTVTCAVCGATVAAEGAVEVAGRAGTTACCSARCADVVREGGADAAGALPALPRRLLVPFDGSGPALRAAEYAVALARATGGEVRLLYAIEPMGLRGLGDVLPAGRLGEVVREVEHVLREDGEAQLRRPRAVCEAAGVPCTVDVVFKLPLEAILEGAQTVDLVVMGSRGRGAMAGALFGSVSQRVLSGTRTPVLIVH